MKTYWIKFESHGTWSEAIEADNMTHAIEMADQRIQEIKLNLPNQEITVVTIEQE